MNVPPLSVRLDTHTDKGTISPWCTYIDGDETKSINTMTSSRELPMPSISRISSLDQAHATLFHCWTRLSSLTRGSPKSALSSESPRSSSTESSNTLSAGSSRSGSTETREYRQWLDQWEVAFTAILSSSVQTMSNDDMTLSRILKANHLACTILSSDADTLTSNAFEAESRAIIELAGAVLRASFLSDSPQDTKPESAPMPASTGLDVKEPLLVVVSRCNQPAIRTRAAELLSRFYQ